MVDIRWANWLPLCHVGNKRIAIIELQGRIVAPLVPDRSGNLATGDTSSSRTSHMARIDFDEVGQIGDGSERDVKDCLGTFLATLRKVGSRYITDQEKICRQQAPRILSATPVDHRKVDLLRSMTGHMYDAQCDILHPELVATLRPTGSVGDLSKLGKDQFSACSDSQTTRPGDVVGVTVRIDDVADLRGSSARNLKIGFNIPKRIKDCAVPSIGPD